MALHTPMADALAQATAYFVSQEDGEDREGIAAFWCEVAHCAANGPEAVVRYLGLVARYDAAIRAEDLAAEEQADRDLATFFAAM